MPEIKIDIRDKRATNLSPDVVIVCGNGSYTMRFTFDGEWDGVAPKYARFVFAKGGEVQYKDVEIRGDVIDVPTLSGIRRVEVGVYANITLTTTAAEIPCELSILCLGGRESQDDEEAVAE